jgi:hypothetical protein
MSYSTLIFAALLVILSLGLLASHWSAWQKADHGGLSSRELLFRRRQFRRRTLASGAIGIVGLLLASGLWMESRLGQLILALLLMIVLLFVILLALLDMLATRVYFGGESAIHSAQVALLKRELEREQARLQESQSTKPTTE